MTDINHDIYPVRIRLKELGPEVDRRAEAETGGNRSKLIRRALDAYLSARTPGEHAGLAELAKAVRELQTDMARVGGNLNQIAHYYNIHDSIQPHELAAEHKELRRQFQALMTIIKKIHEQLRTFQNARA
ncbi:MAG: plasmid mobilization relaxosome protein MobC [Desulfobulbia bacterium]